jgi:hypothetical protein
MCFCEACTKWNNDANGFKGNSRCLNSDHCACCIDCSVSCMGCNHFQVSDTIDIHFHANVGRQPKCDMETEWQILTDFDKCAITTK